MKPIQVHKRLYSVLPRGVATSSSSSPGRARSKSAPRTFYTNSSPPLSFFDSPPPPPPPSSRPTLGSTLRLIQAKPEAESPTSQNSSQSHNQSAQAHNGSGPPLPSVALSSPPSSQIQHPSGQFPPIFSYIPYSTPAYFSPAQPAEAQHADHLLATEHPRYQLDIGGYGIPKNSKPNSARRDWSHPNLRSKHASLEEANLAVQVGEDAYFISDNAMGVADGVGGWKNRTGASSKPTQTPSALFATRLMHYCSEEVSNQLAAGSQAFSESEDADELYSEYEDAISELEEGLDVLMILESAYDRAIKAHVIPAAASESQRQDAPSAPEPSHRPLNAGSSTALVAILQHPSPRPPPVRRSASPHRTRSSSRSRASQSERSAVEEPRSRPAQDAVIKIANLGDSMAMLVRGREIVWRSEEMWWSFNTPVQLGPVSPSRPKDAQVSDVPVQADDILILASDGLSDNLWDEEVLEEVVRIRELLLRHSYPRTGEEPLGEISGMLARRSLAGMLSEALCSRARRVADRGHGGAKVLEPVDEESCDEVPFARRAREEGKRFKGGKVDDISVLVAVVSPVEPALRARP